MDNKLTTAIQLAGQVRRAYAVAFGRMFIANPDLPERIRTGSFLNVFDRSTAYGGDAQSTAIVKLLEDALKTDLRAKGFPAKLTE